MAHYFSSVISGQMTGGLGSLLNLLLTILIVSSSLSSASPLAQRASSTAIDGTQLAPLSVNSRWIVDSTGKRVKLRCANWPGHMEVKIPEGLQHRNVDDISQFIANYGFNCVRLTYSIEGVLSPNTKVSDSFNAAGKETGTNLSQTYQAALAVNPWLAKATLMSTFETVIESLHNKGIRVIMDNQMSKAGWCCSGTDGNGWWDQGDFNTNQWIQGLQAVATMAKSHANVVIMDLRNEPRLGSSGSQIDANSWTSHMVQGAKAVHQTNPDLVISFGGPNYETDLTFLYNSPLDTTQWGGPSKTMYEAHIYAWSDGLDQKSCSDLASYAGNQWGYLLATNKKYTGPVWVSEFGVALSGNSGKNSAGLSDGDYNYLTCLAQYLQGNDADWAIWGIQGDYYVRDNTTNKEETFGVLDKNWQNARNPKLHQLLGSMWNVTQGP